MAIETAMLETLRVGTAAGEIRPGIDLETLADRLCQVLLHVSLGVFRDVRGADEVPAIRCRTLLDGIAVDPPTDTALDRSRRVRGRGARRSTTWEKGDDDEDERLPMLRARRRAPSSGGGATRRRPCGTSPRPPGSSVGSVYRLIGSKDELLGSIMRSFTVNARSGWTQRACRRTAPSSRSWTR